MIYPDDQLMTKLMCMNRGDGSQQEFVSGLDDNQLVSLLICRYADHPYHTFYDAMGVLKQEALTRYIAQFSVEFGDEDTWGI
jgi:hypothetical protein